MNVMLFSKIFEKSGVGNYMCQLAEELVRQGHKVVILSSNNNQGMQEQENIKIVQLPISRKNPIIAAKTIKEIHAIVAQNHIDNHRVAAIYMRLYRIFWKIPVVYALHISPVPHGFIHRILTYAGDIAFGVSTETTEFMKTALRIPAYKVLTIPNGVTPPSVEKIGGGGGLIYL